MTLRQPYCDPSDPLQTTKFDKKVRRRLKNLT